MRSSTATYRPGRQADKQRLADDRQQDHLQAAIQPVEDLKLLMAQDWGRRIAYELLRQGLHLPGQQVSNTNGSLQSYQLGRNDALAPFDERIRRHCNNQWLEMLDEHDHDRNTD